MAGVGAVLEVPAEGRRSALLLRPWLAADMPALISAMRREYPTTELWPNPDLDPLVRPGWTGRKAKWRPLRGWRVRIAAGIPAIA
jgi:hypothetical protein